MRTSERSRKKLVLAQGDTPPTECSSKETKALFPLIRGTRDKTTMRQDLGQSDLHHCHVFSSSRDHRDTSLGCGTPTLVADSLHACINISHGAGKVSQEYRCQFATRALDLDAIACRTGRYYRVMQLISWENTTVSHKPSY